MAKPAVRDTPVPRPQFEEESNADPNLALRFCESLIPALDLFRQNLAAYGATSHFVPTHYSCRDIHIGSGSRQPTAPASDPAHRCPTVTAHLLLFLEEFGATDLKALHEAADRMGLNFAGVPGKVFPEEHPATADLIALRLLMTNEEIPQLFGARPDADKILAAMASVAPSECGKWIAESLAASEHAPGQDDWSSRSFIPTASMFPALARWRRRALALAQVGSSPDDAPARRIMDAVDARLYHGLIWFVQKTSKVDWSKVKKVPQDFLYAASSVAGAIAIADDLKSSPALLRADSEQCKLGSEPALDPTRECDPRAGAKDAADKGTVQTPDTEPTDQIVLLRGALMAARSALLAALDSVRVEEEEEGWSSIRALLGLSWLLLEPKEARRDGSEPAKKLEKVAAKLRDELLSTGTCPQSPRAKFRDEERPVPHPPDVEIVCALAATAFLGSRPSRASAEDIVRYKQVLPCIRTFIETRKPTSKAYRIGDRSLARCFLLINEESGGKKVLAWENYLAARVALFAYRMERAIEQDIILTRYKATYPTWRSQPASGFEPDESSPRQERLPGKDEWLAKVGDAEPYTRTSSTIFEKVVSPIRREQSALEHVCRPRQHGTSFILYGPPGSGKSHTTERLAAFLGWPLVSLSPANFVQGGADKMEENAGRVFKDLMRLDQCVVFFDECDELFRSRREQSANNRNSLSFATASMLPKLQALGKARRVLFVMATNYLHHIDDAVRRDGRFDYRLLVDRPHTAERLLNITSQIRKAKEAAIGTPFAPLTLDATADAGMANHNEEENGRLAACEAALQDALAISTLICLRSTQGYSFTQTTEFVEGFWKQRLASPLAEAVLLPYEKCMERLTALSETFRDGHQLALLRDLAGIANLAEPAEIQRRVRGILAKLKAEHQAWPTTLPEAGNPDQTEFPNCLSETWPVQDERQVIRKPRPGEHPVGAEPATFSGLRESLDSLHAFDIRCPHPPPWPAPQVIDYLDWIVSRADQELAAGTVDPTREVQLKTTWVAIPGFHTYMRQWTDRIVR